MRVNETLRMYATRASVICIYTAKRWPAHNSGCFHFVMFAPSDVALDLTRILCYFMFIPPPASLTLINSFDATPGCSEGSVERLCELCEGLHRALARADLLGRSCKRRSAILRTLFRLVDLNSARLDLCIARLCLAVSLCSALRPECTLAKRGIQNAQNVCLVVVVVVVVVDPLSCASVETTCSTSASWYSR